MNVLHPTNIVASNASTEIDSNEPSKSKEDGLLDGRRALLRNLLLGTGAVLAAPIINACATVRTISEFGTERPAGNTEWKIIRELDDDLMSRIENGEPIMLLIGSEECPHCEPTAEWWKNRSTGGYKPYFLLAERTEDLWNGNINMRGLTRDFEWNQVPLIIFFHNKSKQPKGYADMEIANAQGENNCTMAVAQWLNAQGK